MNVFYEKYQKYGRMDEKMGEVKKQTDWFAFSILLYSELIS